ACEILQRSDGAIDIDGRVRFGVARVDAGNFEPSIALTRENVGDLAEQRRAFRKGQRTKSRPASLASKREGASEIDSCGAARGDYAPIGWVHQRVTFP